MIITKLYLYDSSQEANNYRGTDYSKYVVLADSDVDDLTEVLDTVELTLAGLPFSEEFDPKTKFIYEKWEEIKNDDGTTSLSMWKDWHLCVNEDIVSQPILSDDNYFNHTISFIEASAIAQGRLVDNISVTYRLKDVTLDGKTAIDENAKASVNLQNLEWTPSENFAVWNNYFDAGLRIGKQFYWRFPNWYDPTSPYYGKKEDWTDFGYYQSVDPSLGYKTISLPVPFLEIQTGVFSSKNFRKLGYCSVITVVQETNLGTNETRTILTQETNPAISNAEENNWSNDNEISGITTPGKGCILNRVWFPSGIGFNSYWYSKQVSVFDSQPTNRKITFNALPNCSYTIKVYLKDFKSPTAGAPYGNNYDIEYPALWQASSRISGFIYWGGSNHYESVNNDYPTATLTFRTYLAGSDKRIWLKSAPIENAYSLYQKAQVNTQNVIKQSGVIITETPQAFYLDPADKEELSNTTIVENFYNQKNWWELQLEIGKYIHAIPKIRFGSDDRFITTWQRLGLPTQYNENSNKISIFNSKSIENYIAACSSYITNMVQLGGVIDEWVAPKSSSEDYLVYNDVAEIKTSKNIIEVVDLEIKCINTNSYGINVNEIRNLAGKGTHGESSNGYIFEENVYSLLDITATSLANKGQAIYYSLGSNIIKGLTYRLPTINTGDGDNDYAIKRIIGLAYHTDPTTWKNIKINDFIFHIIYRTKDTVRSDQTRPDLRKYLLNSKYDRVPQHNQFNNQTDVVVDSVKFGNNIYGKLIRTGNSSYTVTEWNTSLNQIKQAGQLYKIRGNIYYVAKVKNTYYQDHIISVVTYSKDYNQLSEIIGIPSEPRFYEISEQSLIKREVPINDYIVVGTSIKSQNNPLSFIKNNGWQYINDLLLGNETDFPKYSITVFKNDEDRKYGTVLGNENFYKDVCHPISTYSIENTLTMEWDMVDNFSAGDEVDKTVLSLEPSSTVDTAYNTLNPVRYTDAYGRSDLLDFIIMRDFGLNGNGLSANQILDLPNSPIRTRFPEYKVYVGTLEGNTLPSSTTLDDYVNSQLLRQPQNGDGIIFILTSTNNGETTKTNYLYLYEDGTWESTEIDNIEEYTKPHISDYSSKYLFGNENIDTMGDNLHGLGLIKDNREQISINYNLQMLTDSDRFVLSAYLWEPAKTDLKIALLSQEINKISNETIPESIILANSIYNFTTNVDTANGVITININSALQNVDLTNVKAIAIISTAEINETIASGAKYFVMGRNITDLSDEEAKSNWYISNYDKNMFPHQ